MKEETNINPKIIKNYLIEKNKDLVDEMVSANFPGINFLGDKVEIIADDLKDQTIERKRDKRGDFLKEAQKDKEISLEESSVDYLKEMVGLLKTMQDDSGIEKKDKDDKSSLKDIAGAGGVGFLRGLKGSGIKGFAKGALKGLGKIALPLTLLLGAFDFAEGFGNALEITGRDDLGAKIQAGISTAIAGISFGLLDPKMISKNIDRFKNFVVNLFTNPIETIKEFAKDFLTVDHIAAALQTVSFGLISEDTIKGGVELIKKILHRTFVEPFVRIKELWDGLDIKGFFDRMMAPIVQIKESWDNLDIKGFFDRMINPLLTLKDSIISGDIFTPLTDWFDNFDLIDFLGIGSLIERVKNFKENMINILSDPKKLILDYFGFGKDKDEKIAPQIIERKISKEDEENIPQIIRRKISKEDEEIIPQKISTREKEKNIISSPSDAIKEGFFKSRILEKRENVSENNTQTIVNSNTNNNIISDDMDISIRNIDSDAYAYSY